MFTAATSEPDLVYRTIGERARSLSERLDSPGRGSTPSTGLAASRLASWSAALSPRDPEAITHRVTWDGLDADDLANVLEPDFSDTPAPGWLETLREVCLVAQREIPEHAPATAPSTTLGESWPPFAEVLLPFVQVASRRLSTQAAILGQTARIQCEKHLLKRLVTHAEQALYESFCGFRDRLTPPGRTPDEAGSALYQLFTASLLRGGLVGFFLEYSVLARSLVRLTDQWSANLNQMLERLLLDADAIAERFGNDAPWDEVTGISLGLSDPHHGGKQVAILTFRGGRSLVYKPKDLGHEAAWHALLQTLRSIGLGEQTPPAARTLTGRGYGWVECMAASGCESQAEVDRYYRRAGAMICLVHALGGDDCHRQNLLATREGPVLVDAESLLRPVLDAWAAGPPRDAATLDFAQKSGRTVLHTGLLPVRSRPASDPLAPPGPDVSGLRGAGGYPARTKRVAWKHPRTDQMELEWETPLSPKTDNLPGLHGQSVLPEVHSEALLEGFRVAYEILLAERDKLVTGQESPLEGMVSGDSRLIFRPTQVYARLLHSLLAPKFMRTGIERSFSFESLARAFITAKDRPFFWPLLALERASLEAGDFPLFNAHGVAEALGLESGSFCVQPATLLANLTPEDLIYQSELIRGTLCETLDWAPAVTKSLSPSLSRNELISEAIRLADELSTRVKLRPGQAFCTDAPTCHFYGGDLGVAVFLAGVERIAPGRGHSSVSREVCDQVERAADVPGDVPDGPAAALGAGNGWGGVIYGLTAIAKLTEDEHCLNLAVEIARRQITPARIASDRFYDAIGGTAGAIFGLLALYELSGDPAVLDLAAGAGRHLLSSRLPGPRGGFGWPAPTPAAQMLAGFPHGAGGISVALRRLAAHLPGGPFLEAAQDALVYERSVFVSTHRDWPYLHAPLGEPGKEPVFFKTWCHGAPSVALARLGCLGGPDDTEVRADLETALGTAANVGLPLPGLDHLCCGNFGRIGILDLAGRRLGRMDLRQRALAWAALTMRRAAAGGGYQLDSAPGERSPHPAAGLFRGLAGIGFGLLKLAEPDLLPEILLWE